jgi:hypothetical protein
MVSPTVSCLLAMRRSSLLPKLTRNVIEYPVAVQSVQVRRLRCGMNWLLRPGDSFADTAKRLISDVSSVFPVNAFTNI